MIKQFNFYDIYGYLLPGTLLLGLFWLPVAAANRSWADQDLSKALFLTALAYIAGHLIQSVASSLVPSKLVDSKDRLRTPSELLLDSDNPAFSQGFKDHLASQVQNLFHIDLGIGKDADGHSSVSQDRGVAFFQARAYLIARKDASYVEQFEGLYVMMRGLACALCAGAAYLGGWAVAFHHELLVVSVPMAVIALFALVVILISAWRRKPAGDQLRSRIVWLLLFFGAGFWISSAGLAPFSAKSLPHPQAMLWASAAAALIAAAKCMDGYRNFANSFATTVWRDFSASVSLDASSAAAKPSSTGASKQED